MTSATSSIEPLEALGGSSTSLDLAELNQARYDEQDQRADFDAIAQRAIETAIDRPGGHGEISGQRREYLGGQDGAVGDVKSEITSDVSRGDTQSPTEDNKDVEESLETRMLSLYTDLTAYQVAWRIAQKIPQDLSQILKGN